MYYCWNNPSTLQTIKPADIATVRKLQKPPHLIMRIMDAVLLLFQRKVSESRLMWNILTHFLIHLTLSTFCPQIDTVSADPERPCPKPSWAEAMKLMQNSSFLSMLLNFSKVSFILLYMWRSSGQNNDWWIAELGEGGHLKEINEFQRLNSHISSE